MYQTIYIQMLWHLKDDKRKPKLEDIQATNVWVSGGGYKEGEAQGEGALGDHDGEKEIQPKGFTLQGVPGQGKTRDWAFSASHLDSAH